MPAAEAAYESAAVLKPAPKAEKTVLLLSFVSRFCFVKVSCFGIFLSRNALPSVICVTKLLDVVGNFFAADQLQASVPAAEAA